MWQVHTLAGHSRGVRTVAFSPDGKFIVSGSEDRLVKMWDAATAAEVCNHRECRVTSLIRNRPTLGPYSRTIPRTPWWSWGGGWFL